MAQDNISLHYWDWNEDPEDTLDADGKNLEFIQK